MQKALLCVAMMLLPLTVLSALPPARQDVVSWPEWYLDKNMVDMTPENRFVSSVVFQNPGATPIYVRASIKRISLGTNGQREIAADDGGALRVFPDEMVLPPGGGFTARLLVDAAKMSADSQSYYVHFEDVTRLHLGGDGQSSGLAAGFLLAYDVMVAVHRQPKNKLDEADIVFARNAAGKLALTNRSGQHIYLNRGYACGNTQQALVDCAEWPSFPRQTLLPGETVAVAEPLESAQRQLGLLAYPVLNSRRPPNRFFLPVPKAANGAAAVSAPAR